MQPDPATIRASFAGVDCWIFDLDNTLYAPELRLFDQIEARMNSYVRRLLGIDADAANRLRAEYWRQHGTTLAGLMARHAIDPEEYLAEVHAIDLSALAPDPMLTAAIAALPGRRIVHTNADSAYAGRVLARRQLSFDAIFGIGEVGYHPKPDPRSFAAVLAAQGLDPARCAMFEDDARNLEVPYSLGMQTILVGPGHRWPDEASDGHGPGRHVLWQAGELGSFLATLAAALADMANCCKSCE